MYTDQQPLRYWNVSCSDTELIQRWVGCQSPRRRRSSWRLAKQFQAFAGKPFSQVTAADIRAFGKAKASEGIAPQKIAQMLLGIKSLFIFGYELGVLPVNIPPERWPKIRLKKRSRRKKPSRKLGFGLGLSICCLALIVPGFLNKVQSTPPALSLMAREWDEPNVSGQLKNLYAQTATPLKSPNTKAFLDLIAVAEGTAGSDGYRTQFTGVKFDSFHTHPDQVQCAYSNGRRICSSAAGRYQFLKPTFDRLKRKLALPDFGPRSQDLAAIELIREQGALEDIEAGNIKAALRKVSSIWVHIEGAGYGQPEYSLDKLEAMYWRERKKYEPTSQAQK